MRAVPKSEPGLSVEKLSPVTRPLSSVMWHFTLTRIISPSPHQGPWPGLSLYFHGAISSDRPATATLPCTGWGHFLST